MWLGPAKSLRCFVSDKQNTNSPGPGLPRHNFSGSDEQFHLGISRFVDELTNQQQYNMMLLVNVSLFSVSISNPDSQARVEI